MSDYSSRPSSHNEPHSGGPDRVGEPVPDTPAADATAADATAADVDPATESPLASTVTPHVEPVTDLPSEPPSEPKAETEPRVELDVAFADHPDESPTDSVGDLPVEAPADLPADFPVESVEPADDLAEPVVEPLPADASEMDADRFREVATTIETELSKLMVGQAELIRLALIAMIGGGHVLLEGVPGLGKTVLVRSLASSLHLEFARVQFTPDLMPGDITGSHIVNEDENGRKVFEFVPGPLFTNLLLADEINRATPKTQSALLEAMAERQVTTADHTRPLPAPFFVLATQNPIENEGTYPLPEAQLDRFFFKLNVTLPDPADLVEIALRTTGAHDIEISPVAKGEELLAMGRLAKDVPIARHVMERAANIIAATHPDRPEAPEEVRKYVRWGASPRGMQTIIIGARIRALLAGRFNVSFEDLATVALPALRHRMFLNFEADAAGVSADTVIAAVIAHLDKE